MAKCPKPFVPAGVAMILTALMGVLATSTAWVVLPVIDGSFSVSLWKTWAYSIDKRETRYETSIDDAMTEANTKYEAGFIPDDPVRMTTSGEIQNDDGETKAQWEARHSKMQAWYTDIKVLRAMSIMTALSGFFSALAFFKTACKPSVCSLCLALILQVLTFGTSMTGVVMGVVLKHDSSKLLNAGGPQYQVKTAAFIGIVLAASFSLISLLSCTLPASVMVFGRGGGPGRKIQHKISDAVARAGFGHVAGGMGAGGFNNLQESGGSQANRWPAAPAPVAAPVPVSYGQQFGPPPSLAPPCGNPAGFGLAPPVLIAQPGQ